MIDFYISTLDGQITMTGQCGSENELSFYEKPGTFVLAGVASIGKDYFDGEKVAPLPAPPSSHHIFNYTTKRWEDPRTDDTEWPLVRARRNDMLSASDWTQLPDVPLNTKEAWAVYRQALRDVTEQLDPFNIVWPVAPG